jgi:hypothetical protein
LHLSEFQNHSEKEYEKIMRVRKQNRAPSTPLPTSKTPIKFYKEEAAIKSVFKILRK